MWTTRQLAIAGAALVGTFGLAGCGDDTAAALSKPEFIEQANALCQATDDRLEPVFEAMWEGVDDWDDPAAQEVLFVRFDEVIAVAAPAWREMADAIRALGPPKGDEALIASLLDDLDAGVDEMQSTIEAAVAGDVEAREKLDGDDASDPLADVDRRAREYGLTVCGDDS